MNAIAAKSSYTPEELLAMPDEKNYELVDGQLVERNMSTLSSWVAGRISRYLDVYAEENQLGWIFPADNGYQCFPDAPGKVRKPDVSFVRRDRLPENASSTGYMTIAPDLAVEVLSPNDLAWEIDRKVADYLGAGVRLVWVVHPVSRAVAVHRLSGPVSWLREEDELSGEDVLPGFHRCVGTIFPPWGADTGALPDLLER
jgi:Uma2 family endonuclease